MTVFLAYIPVYAIFTCLVWCISSSHNYFRKPVALSQLIGEEWSCKKYKVGNVFRMKRRKDFQKPTFHTRNIDQVLIEKVDFQIRLQNICMYRYIYICILYICTYRVHIYMYTVHVCMNTVHTCMYTVHICMNTVHMHGYSTCMHVCGTYMHIYHTKMHLYPTNACIEYACIGVKYVYACIH